MTVYYKVSGVEKDIKFISFYFIFGKCLHQCYYTLGRISNKRRAVIRLFMKLPNLHLKPVKPINEPRVWNINNKFDVPEYIVRDKIGSS